jgi:hypothetical protein
VLIALADAMLGILQPASCYLDEEVSSKFCAQIGVYIQEACALTSEGEKDELRIYQLAFRWHVLQNSEARAIMEVFQKVCDSSHVSGDELLECFSVLAAKRMA